MRTVERTARTLVRDGWVHPVGEGVYRVTDPSVPTVYTVTNYRCNCRRRKCAHTLAVLAFETYERQAVVW